MIPQAPLFKTEDYVILAVLGLVLTGLVLLVRRLRGARRPPGGQGPTDYLDQAVGVLAGVLPVTRRMLTEGIAVILELGGGKTLLIGRELALMLLRSRMGGLVLAAKPEDRAMWENWCRETGRLDDLVVVAPGGGAILNPLEQIRAVALPGHEAEAVAQAIMEGQELGRRRTKGGGDPFFDLKNEDVFYCAAVVHLEAKEPFTFRSFNEFITGLVPAAEYQSEGFQKSWTNALLRRACQEGKTNEGDLRYALSFLLDELGSLNDRTFTSIKASATALLGKVSRGAASQIFNGVSTVHLSEALEGRKILLVDHPPAVHGDGAAFLGGVIKAAFNKTVLRRDIGPHTPLCFLWLDEAPRTVTAADAEHQAVCRSFRQANVYLAQSVTGLVSARGGGIDAQAEIESLLSNIGLKVFGATTDAKTQQYASQLCGQDWSYTLNGSLSMQPTSVADVFLGSTASQNAGYHETLLPLVRPEEFAAMAKPSAASPEADAVIVGARLNELFGRHWRRVRFQKHYGR